ncbi:MAG: NHL repeat-containing protein [Planctomycetes bacterium]|nr:NHL repeat-containing protein [Planctomycetota bacterium]
MWIRSDELRCCIVSLLLLIPGVLCGRETPAGAADFQYPIAIATAKDGTIYVADRNLPGIWKIVDGKATIFHQASKRFRTPLNAIRCLAIDSKGRLLAGDSATRDIYRFEKQGKPKPLTAGRIGIPMAIAADGKGMLFVADLEVGRIWKVPEAGGKPVEVAVLRGPRGVAVDKDANVWIVCTGQNPLRRISPGGKIEVVVAGRPFRFAHNVVLDTKGNAYVSDGYAKTIWKIPPKGKPEKWVSGLPMVNPVGLAWKGANLLVVDPRANAVFEISPEAKLKTLIAGPRKK